MMNNCNSQTKTNTHSITNYFFSYEINFAKYNEIIESKDGIESEEITDNSWNLIEKTYTRKYKTSDSIVEKSFYDDSSRLILFEKWIQFYGSSEPNKWILNEKDEYKYKIDTIEIKHYNYGKYLDTDGYRGKEIRYLDNNKISKIEYFDFINNLQSVETYTLISDTIEQVVRKYVKENIPNHKRQTTYDSMGRVLVVKINQDIIDPNDSSFNQIWEFQHNDNDDIVEERYFYDNKLMEFNKVDLKYRNKKWIYKKITSLRGSTRTIIRKIE